jgi:hypothetical protein
LGGLGEPTYRLYNCQRCGVQVRICQRCDRGNIYCPGECSRIRRVESLHRAATRYQHSRRGAHRHAARQRALRVRQQQIVTHQGSPSPALGRSVSGSSMLRSHPIDAYRTEPTATHYRPPEPLDRCAFCRAGAAAMDAPAPVALERMSGVGRDGVMQP